MVTFDEAYFKGLVYLGAPGIALAVLTLLGGIIYCCVRFVCGGSRSPPSQKSSKDRWTIYALLIVVWSFLFISLTIGLSGNAQVHTAISDTVDDVLDVLGHIQQLAESVYDVMATVDPSTAADFQQVENDVIAVTNYVTDIRDNVVHYDGIRKQIVDAAICLAFVIAFLAIIGLVCKQYALSHVMLVVVIITTMFLWIIFAVHLPAAKAANDACDEFNQINVDLASLSGSQTCLSDADSQSAFTTVRGVLQPILTGLKNNATFFGTTFNDTLPTTLNGNSVDAIHSLTAWLRAQLTSVQNAIATYPDTPAKRLINSTITTIENISDVMDQLVTLTSCDYIPQLIQSVLGPKCTTLTKGLNYVAGTAPTIAILHLISLVLFLILFAQLLVLDKPQMEGAGIQHVPMMPLTDVEPNTTAPAPTLQVQVQQPPAGGTGGEGYTGGTG